jgi:DNA-binding transcriptional ArsR family regulator
VEIKIPEPIGIEQKETLPDKRKFSVVPLSALRDKRLSAQVKVVLSVVCSFCNRAGITHVSQEKVAQELGVTQGRISRAIARLKRLGYIEQIGRPKPGLRGGTLRIIYDPTITTEDAIAIAGSEQDEDLRSEDMREQQAAEMIANERWTESELKANKERLAKMLIQTFDTVQDKPRMYNPVQGDTLAVKQAKQAIRARMRQLRAEEMSQSAYKDKHENMSETAYKHKELRLYAVTDKEQNTVETHVDKRIQTRMEYEDCVLYFQKQLKNGVQTERDLQTCALLAEHNVTRETLDQYIKQHSTDTVTQLGDRILGTVCK